MNATEQSFLFFNQLIKKYPILDIFSPRGADNRSGVFRFQ